MCNAKRAAMEKANRINIIVFITLGDFTNINDIIIMAKNIERNAILILDHFNSLTIILLLSILKDPETSIKHSKFTHCTHKISKCHIPIESGHCIKGYIYPRYTLN